MLCYVRLCNVCTHTHTYTYVYGSWQRTDMDQHLSHKLTCSFFLGSWASCPTIWWYVRPGGLCAFADSCWDAWTRCWLGESIGHRYDVLLLFVEPSWHKTGNLCLFPQRCEVGCSSRANSKKWGLNKSYTCWKQRRIRRLAIFRCGCLKMGMPVLPKWQLQWG